MSRETRAPGVDSIAGASLSAKRQPRGGVRTKVGLPGFPAVITDPPVGSRLRAACLELQRTDLTQPLDKFDLAFVRTAMSIIEHEERLLVAEMHRRASGGRVAPKHSARKVVRKVGDLEAFAVPLVVRYFMLCCLYAKKRRPLHSISLADCKRTATVWGPGITPNDVRKCVRAFMTRLGRNALEDAWHATRGGERGPDVAHAATVLLRTAYFWLGEVGV